MNDQDKSPGYVETEAEAAKRAVLAVWPDAYMGIEFVWRKGPMGEVLYVADSWEEAATLLPKSACLSHPEVAAQSSIPTCPLPLHNPLRQKDGTYKCSGCDRTWNEYPTVTVVWPKARTK